MKPEGYMFAVLTAFFAVVATAYGVLSREWAGTTALALSAGLTFLIAFYVIFTGRRIDPRPEDDAEADITEGAGELGFFSPHSWWPLPLAASTAIIAVGFVFGWWLVIIGTGVLFISLWGLVFEYHRGDSHA